MCEDLDDRPVLCHTEKAFWKRMEQNLLKLECSFLKGLLHMFVKTYLNSSPVGVGRREGMVLNGFMMCGYGD